MLARRPARLAWCVVLGAASGAGHNARGEAAASAPAARPSPVYRIYPLLDGRCRIRGDHAFHNGSPAEVYDYALYVWLVLGGERPMLIDAGMTDVAAMNEGAARVLYEPIRKRPGENSREQLARFGLSPDDIGHVFVTHLHWDHVDDLLQYRNATIHVGRREWELASRAAPSWGHVRILEAFRGDPAWKQRLDLVGDQPVLPGIESFWIGGHTAGSTAYRVRTSSGWAVVTGDTVSLLANLERNVPPGVFTSLDECLAGMAKVREKADMVLPSHDPRTADRWPVRPAGAARHSIRAIKVGECQVRDSITFQGGPAERTSTFYLYVWAIEGGDRTILVETGPRDPAAFSRATAAYIPGGVAQSARERTPEALRIHGIDPADVSHVIATHLHADHYDYFDLFPNARLVVNRREYEQNRDHLAAGVAKALADRPGALQLVDDEEIVPGVRVVPIGGHTEGSQAVRVETHLGPAVLTGDTVYKYENIEQRRPAQSADPKACLAAMDRIRGLADIVLPAHDPLTLRRWPEGLIGERVPTGERLDISAMNLVVPAAMSRPLQYAVEQVQEFARRSASLEIGTVRDAPADRGLVVLVGREQADREAPWLCRRIPWQDLGDEGYALRLGRCGRRPLLIAAGATEAGTRQAVYALLRELDVSRLPAGLPADLDRVEKPSFGLRGMYAHQHWAYEYPYALRTWKVEEWAQYVDALALLRVNLLQIWSMAGILPVPFSPQDEAFLRRYPPVIDHARRNHGMTVWIGECANNVCDRRDVPPAAQRDYFAVESLKNPADPAQMAQLRAARAEFYKVCDNADGYWVIDSDPGKWPGSPSSEFVDILMMNRELITAHARLGPDARLIYWMWYGWGTEPTREGKWRSTLLDLVRRNPEPWWMTVAGPEHWKVADELGLAARVVYYPYNAVEREPSLPFTTVMPQNLREAMNVPERVGTIRGVMANAQTPVCQWPNIAYFCRSAWNLDWRGEGAESTLRELARLICPEQADLLAQAWACAGDPAAPEALALADRLERVVRDHRLGRLGPLGMKLFPDAGQIARDLAKMLRIHSAAGEFVRMAGAGDADERRLVDQLAKYCVLSLAWRKDTGFRNFGTNRVNFPAVHDAVHRRWWHGNRLDSQVRDALSRAMMPAYEEWEAKLIFDALER